MSAAAEHPPDVATLERGELRALARHGDDDARRELARREAANAPLLTADQTRELRRILTAIGAPTPGGGARDPDE